MLKLEFDDLRDPTIVNGRSTNFSSNANINGRATNDAADGKLQRHDFPELQSIFLDVPLSYTSSNSSLLLHKLKLSGFINDDDIASFAMDFASRPETLSQILIQDFDWNAIDAHRARAGITRLVRKRSGTKNHGWSLLQNKDTQEVSDPNMLHTIELNSDKSNEDVSVAFNNNITAFPKATEERELTPKAKLAPWKSVLVNDKAKLRRRVKEQKNSDNGADETNSVETDKDCYNYGLLDNESDRLTYRTLFEELDNFWSYMTVPQTASVSEPPIRERTAEVYMRHARLFLGWVVDARENVLHKNVLHDVDDAIEMQMATKSPLTRSTSKAGMLSEAINVRNVIWKRLRQRMGKDLLSEVTKYLSLTDIFLDQDAESVTVIVQYILWLRSERSISSNYEANILRGLIKIVKFRFAGELSLTINTVRSATSKTPLDDIPVVIELRKFHREAGNRSKKAPRSSDEGKKWLDWREYLEVIELLKADLGEMIEKYEIETTDRQQEQGDNRVERQKSFRLKQKEIATIFQHYLILSFFACVPDRQRTFRELQLNKNFLRVNGDSNEKNVWMIKHSSDDYKTGGTYGERPPLPLLPSLTPAIDDFIKRWRPCLLRDSEGASSSSFLFHQPKTGNPLTPNSMYQIVSRCCYKYKQRKTNPHLLRDMIVTHVRKNSDASEKELEALALYMGHSVQMQRESYDR